MLCSSRPALAAAVVAAAWTLAACGGGSETAAVFHETAAALETAAVAGTATRPELGAAEAALALSAILDAPPTHRPGGVVLPAGRP